MGYVLVGAALGLLPSFLLMYLLITVRKDHSQERSEWSQERTSLLNRAMSKDLTTLLTLQGQTVPLVSASDQYYPGMSDEEELRRMGHDLAGIQGIGDVYAEIEQDAVELGLRPE